MGTAGSFLTGLLGGASGGNAPLNFAGGYNAGGFNVDPNAYDPNAGMNAYSNTPFAQTIPQVTSQGDVTDPTLNPSGQVQPATPQMQQAQPQQQPSSDQTGGNQDPNQNPDQNAVGPTWFMPQLPGQQAGAPLPQALGGPAPPQLPGQMPGQPAVTPALPANLPGGQPAGAPLPQDWTPPPADFPTPAADQPPPQDGGAPPDQGGQGGRPPGSVRQAPPGYIPYDPQTGRPAPYPGQAPPQSPLVNLIRQLLPQMAAMGMMGGMGGRRRPWMRGGPMMGRRGWNPAMGGRPPWMGVQRRGGPLGPYGYGGQFRGPMMPGWGVPNTGGMDPYNNPYTGAPDQPYGTSGLRGFPGGQTPNPPPGTGAPPAPDSADDNPASQTPNPNLTRNMPGEDDTSGAAAQGTPPADTANGYGADQSQQTYSGRPRPNFYGGRITIGGQSFSYGTGGGRTPSIPYGTYYVHPGAIGPIGRSIGAVAGVSDSNSPGDNTIHDPQTRRVRQGIEIHRSASGRTNGCIGISEREWPAFRQAFARAAANGQGLRLTVRPDGSASITPVQGQNIARGGRQVPAWQTGQVF